MNVKTSLQTQHLSDPSGLITYNTLLPLTYTYFLRSSIPELEALEAKQNETQNLDEEESQTLAASMYIRHFLAYQFSDTDTVSPNPTQYHFLGTPYWKIFRNCTLPKNFPSFSTQKKSRKFAGRIGRFLRNYKILQILRQYFILPKKTRACSQKILQFTPTLSPKKLIFIGNNHKCCCFGYIDFPYVPRICRNSPRPNKRRLERFYRD